MDISGPKISDCPCLNIALGYMQVLGNITFLLASNIHMIQGKVGVLFITYSSLYVVGLPSFTTVSFPGKMKTNSGSDSLTHCSGLQQELIERNHFCSQMTLLGRM
jgi:hypothetical protein